MSWCFGEEIQIYGMFERKQIKFSNSKRARELKLPYEQKDVLFLFI